LIYTLIPEDKGGNGMSDGHNRPIEQILSTLLTRLGFPADTDDLASDNSQAVPAAPWFIADQMWAFAKRHLEDTACQQNESEEDEA
jgi:hypothetical protein